MPQLRPGTATQINIKKKKVDQVRRALCPLLCPHSGSELLAWASPWEPMVGKMEGRR